MATLSQALRQQRQGTTVRGPGGALSEEAPDEIQKLAGQAGLQAPPTTPLGAAALGANPDQQKMQGTPAQKTAALSLALQPPEQGLAGALRRQQSRTDLTQEEQGQKQKNTDMQNLGNLGDRVTQFIDTQRQLLQEQQAPVEVNALDQFQGQDITGLKNLLGQLRANPNDMNLQLQVQQALGRNVNSTLSPDEINKLYEDSVSAISKGGAANVDDSLTVSDLVSQGSFGYDAAEIAQLLGLSEQQVAGLSVGQLRNEIQRVGDQEFSNAQRLDQQAQSGLLGQAERGLARQAGREASATGVRATEADYSNMEQQIQNADQVTFGGKNYSVEDLLKDDTISGIITEYMNAPEGSEVRKRLEATEPGLMEFINRNKTVLAEAAQKLGGGAQEFTGVQEANKQVGTFGSQRLDEGLLKQLVPGFGELQASKFNQDEIQPLANIKQTRSPEDTVQTINAGLQKDREAVNELFGQLNPQEFNAMFSQGGTRFNNYVQSRQDFNNLKNVVSSGNPQQLVTSLTNTGDMNQFKDSARNMFVASQLGLADPNSNAALFQAGQWAHNPDYLTDWLKRFGNTAVQPDVKNAAQGNIPQPPKVNVTGVTTPSGIQKTAMDKLGGLLSGNNTNGTITADAAASKGMSMYEMQQMMDAGMLKGPAFNPEFKQQFENRQNVNYQKNMARTSVDDTANKALGLFNDPEFMQMVKMGPGVYSNKYGDEPWSQAVSMKNDAISQLDSGIRATEDRLKDPSVVAELGKGNLERKLQEFRDMKSRIEGINLNIPSRTTLGGSGGGRKF